MTGAKKAGVLVAGGVLGALYPLAVAALASALSLTPNYPAHAGEDDFALRFAVFGALVIPAFAAVGMWIALGVGTGRHAWRASVLGAAVGTVVSFLAQAAAAGVIGTLSTSSQANRAVFVFYAAWITFSVAGVVIANLATRRKAASV